jgi:hypothetical protein
VVEPDCSALAGRQDEVGPIQVGKRADLVLLALDEVTTALCGPDRAAVVKYGGCRGRRHGVHRRQGEEVGRRARRGRLRLARPRGARRSRRESELQGEERRGRLLRIRTFGDGASAARQGRENPAENRGRGGRARTQQVSEAVMFGFRGCVAQDAGSPPARRSRNRSPPRPPRPRSDGACAGSVQAWRPR